MTVSSAWCGRMPARVSRQNAAAMVSSEGNRRGGKTPSRATISQTAPTTRNGNALRQISPPARLGFFRGGERNVCHAAIMPVVSRSGKMPPFPFMKPATSVVLPAPA
jgi:hypothetical protein